MKKILCFILMCCTIFCFAACNDEVEDYWTNTSTVWTTFSTKAEFQTYITPGTDIAFVKDNADIRTNLSANQYYKPLVDAYETTLQNCFVYINSLSGGLAIAPVDTNTKKLFESFEKQVGILETTLNEFITKKQDFCSRIDIQNLSSELNKQLAREFKREYRKIVNVALDTMECFETLYETAYESLPTEGETISAVNVKYIELKLLNLLVKQQIEYMKEFDVDYETYDFVTIINKGDAIRSNITNAVDKPLAEYNQRKAFYENYKKEYNNFLTALNNIDTQKYNTDYAEYIEEKPVSTSYYAKIDYMLNYALV